MPKQTKALALQFHPSNSEHSSLLNLIRIRFIQFSLFFLFATLIALTSPILRAQDQLIIAGIQGSSQSSYSYLGLIQPLEKSALGKGWYRKILISHLTYRYLQTNPNTGITIHATAPGIEGGFGHAWSGTLWSIDLSATVGYRNISLSPISPAADDKGGIFILNPQIQARYQFTEKLDADLLANHSLGQGSTYARERLGWRLASFVAHCWSASWASPLPAHLLACILSKCSQRAHRASAMCCTRISIGSCLPALPFRV